MNAQAEIPKAAHASVESVAFIGKCLVKGCKCVVRRDIPARVVTRTMGYRYTYKKTTLQALWHPSQEEIYCREHKRQIFFRRIEGTFSPDHICDSRCVNATGHNCECSCGGANHGKHYCG